MSYATLEALQSRLRGVYDGIYGDETADADAAADLAAAAARIDGRIACRYAVPVVSPPALLAEWQLVLACEIAYSRAAAPTMPDKLQRRIDQVYAEIDRAAAGTLALPGAVESERAGAAMVAIEEPSFTRRKMRDW